MIRPCQRLLAIGLVLLIAACSGLPDKPKSRPTSKPKPSPTQSGRYALPDDIPPAPHEIPADIDKTPDAVPMAEPPSASGNPDYYTVFGKTYFVKKSVDAGHTDSGKASWYAKKFHGHKTASGEIYNMFGMTAAHKTLPLPTYVRVTREDNGKSCIVKVNDRGPFHPGRVIDLSYAAAARLDMIRAGEAEVTVEVVDVEELAPAPARVVVASMSEAKPWQPGYWHIAFEDPIDAALMREELRSAGLRADMQQALEDGHELLGLMIGPFAEEAASRNAAELLRARGLEPAWRVN